MGIKTRPTATNDFALERTLVFARHSFMKQTLFRLKKAIIMSELSCTNNTI